MLIGNTGHFDFTVMRLNSKLAKNDKVRIQVDVVCIINALTGPFMKGEATTKGKMEYSIKSGKVELPLPTYKVDGPHPCNPIVKYRFLVKDKLVPWITTEYTPEGLKAFISSDSPKDAGIHKVTLEATTLSYRSHYQSYNLFEAPILAPTKITNSDFSYLVNISSEPCKQVTLKGIKIKDMSFTKGKTA